MLDAPCLFKPRLHLLARRRLVHQHGLEALLLFGRYRILLSLTHLRALRERTLGGEHAARDASSELCCHCLDSTDERLAVRVVHLVSEPRGTRQRGPLAVFLEELH